MYVLRVDSQGKELALGGRYLGSNGGCLLFFVWDSAWLLYIQSIVVTEQSDEMS